MKASGTDDEEKSFEHELAGKYLTFNLAGELYALPIQPINDIIEMQEYTEVPRTADYVRGVINLRGTVIPVIDLREKFGLETKEYDDKTCIIVVEIDGMQTGLVVDRVSEVLEFGDEQIDPSPKMSADVQVEFIAGIGKREEAVHMLLNIEQIMEKKEIQSLEQEIDQREE